MVIYRVPLMLERQWREQCAELPRGQRPRRQPPTPAGARLAALQPGRPPSACPKCKAPITALQNVPVLSYLILRGRCANCGNPICVRYPLIEALTGVLSARLPGNSASVCRRWAAWC